MGRLEDKTAIVTGAGSNIGRAIALLLSEEEAKVSVWDIDRGAGKETVNLIRERGGEASFIYCDVTNIESIKEASNNSKDKYGKVDILVNNVGNAKGISLESIDKETFNKCIDINLKSAFFCTKIILKQMKEKREGSVVFVSSINALLGGFSETAYSASKAGLHSLVKSLTADYSKYGIRFNVVCPGTIPEASRTWKEREENNPGTIEKLKELFPLNGYGNPEDVANAVLFLASEESKWISGVVLPVDGGLTASGGLPGGEWWKKL